MPKGPCPWQQSHERVNHDVAHQVHPLGRNPLRTEVVNAVPGWREEQVRQPVGDDAVDLLRHRPVAAPEARLDVRDLEAELGGDERGCDRGVDVAVDEHHGGRGAEAHLLKALHDQRGLRRMRARADLEVVIGTGDAELPEEAVRHLRVVVLAGVDDDVADSGPARGGPRERGQFHEVGARAHDGEKDQGCAPQRHLMRSGPLRSVHYFSSCTSETNVSGREIK